MNTRTLRARNTGLMFVEWRDSKAKTGPLKRFRHCIEETDWDEELLRNMGWVDGFTAALAAAGLLYVVCTATAVFLK